MMTKKSCHCIHLRRAANAVSTHYNDHLAPLHITINQYSLLHTLIKMPDCSVSDLAKKVNLERTTLVRSLKPLIEQGLIKDLANATQRKRKLQISKAGMQVLEQAEVHWDSAQKEMEKQFSEDELEQFLYLIKKLEQY